MAKNDDLISHVKRLAAKLKNLGIIGHINIQRMYINDPNVPTYKDGCIPDIVVNLFNEDDANLFKLCHHIDDNVPEQYRHIKIAVLKKDT